MEAQAAPSAESLRAELKAWEKAFSEKHKGRKATRDEIKQYPDIGILVKFNASTTTAYKVVAQRYKLYNKIRSHVPNPAPTVSSSSPPPKKRKPSPLCQKSKPQIQTHPFTLDPYDSPRKSSDIHLTSSNHNRKWIGPTPQKNGVAIGLFDFLSPDLISKKICTPSKSPVGIDVSAREIAITPSKRHIGEIDETGGDVVPLSQKALPESKHHPSRTPQSVSKRLFLSQFLAAYTPSHSRSLKLQTPSSRLRRGAGTVSKLILGETPEYLKRDSQHAFSLITKQDGQSRPDTADDVTLGKDFPQKDDNHPLEWSPIAVRLPRKPIGRTLSSLVQNLRETQEQDLDEDLDILREIENGPSSNAKLRRPKLLVRDSQVQEPMPFDPEDLGFESLGEEVQQDENDEVQGGKQKIWKKKGQKRTTRRVIMRPVVSKWQPEQEWRAPLDEENEVIEESQVAAKPMANVEESGSEFGEEGSNDGDDAASIQQKTKTPGAKVAIKRRAKSKDSESKVGDKKERKTGRAQPQNFRALKMKNKAGANGIGRAKSKFGKGGFRRR